MRLDELVLTAHDIQDYRKRAIPPRKVWMTALPVLYLGVIVPTYFDYWNAALPFLAGLLLWTTWTCYWGMKLTNAEYYYSKVFRKLFDDIPIDVQVKGRGIWGYGYDADISIAECYECHIEGDCPLCGAE